ncbi:hypothetical protein RQN30_06725 [Arcanobacterium hippocoleae]
MSVLVFGLLASVGGLVPITAFSPAAFAVEFEKATFEYAKEHVKPQTLSFGEYQIKIWILATGSYELNNSREFVIFGETALPHTAQELGVAEESGKFYLPFDSNYVLTNGALRTWLAWQTVGNKWDSRVFKSNTVLRSAKDTFKLVVAGNEVELKVPDAAEAGLNLEPLESAVTEHFNIYSAAQSRGMEFTADTLRTFMETLDIARALIANAATENKPSQAQADEARKKLNIAASELKPKPFDRTELNELIAQANAKFAQNGKGGKRYLPAAYEKLSSAYKEAVRIVQTPDYDSIQVSGHGKPQITHKDFRSAADKLRSVLVDLPTESFKSADVSALQAAYNSAIMLMPAKGNGFAADSREAFMRVLENVKEFLVDTVYATPESVSAQFNALSRARDALQEVNLGKEIKIKVSYQHPMWDAVSDLIHENFRGNQGEVVEEILSVRDGEEVRIPLTHPLIKKFAGFAPVSFHLNSDDGSHRFARVFVLPNGKNMLAFRASAANSDGVGSLVVRYASGVDNRVLSLSDGIAEAEESGGAAAESGEKKMQNLLTAQIMLLRAVRI